MSLKPWRSPDRSNLETPRSPLGAASVGLAMIWYAVGGIKVRHYEPYHFRRGEPYAFRDIRSFRSARCEQLGERRRKSFRYRPPYSRVFRTSGTPALDLTDSPWDRRLLRLKVSRDSPVASPQHEIAPYVGGAWPRRDLTDTTSFPLATNSCRAFSIRLASDASMGITGRLIAVYLPMNRRGRRMLISATPTPHRCKPRAR